MHKSCQRNLTPTCTQNQFETNPGDPADKTRTTRTSGTSLHVPLFLYVRNSYQRWYELCQRVGCCTRLACRRFHIPTRPDSRPRVFVRVIRIVRIVICEHIAPEGVRILTACMMWHEPKTNARSNQSYYSHESDRWMHWGGPFKLAGTRTRTTNRHPHKLVPPPVRVVYI